MDSVFKDKKEKNNGAWDLTVLFLCTTCCLLFMALACGFMIGNKAGYNTGFIHGLIEGYEPCNCPEGVETVKYIEVPSDKPNNECDRITWLYDRYMGDKEYSLGEYDCTQFSQDFKDILEEKGYTVIPKFGMKQSESAAYGQGLHSWIEVCIPFEATSGRFISQGEYEEDYKEVVDKIL